MRNAPPSPPLSLALLLAASTAILGALAFLGSRPSAVPLATPGTLVPDLNASPPRHLLLIPGVGPVRARAIVEERERGGPFASAGDLRRIPGIGPATAEALAPFLSDPGRPGPTEGGP